MVVKVQKLVVAALLSAISLIPISAQADSIITRSITTAPGVSIDTSLYIPSKWPAPAI